MYNHPQANCFIVSQLISVARHVRCLKLGFTGLDNIYI